MALVYENASPNTYCQPITYLTFGPNTFTP